MRSRLRSLHGARWRACFALAALLCAGGRAAAGTPLAALEAKDFSLRVERDGSYTLHSAGQARPVLQARIAAQVDHHWLRSSDYPDHEAAQSAFQDELGGGRQITLLCKGLTGRPDLAAIFRQHEPDGFIEVLVEVRNGSGVAQTVQAVRPLEAVGRPVLDLGGREPADRILSDSFSEDRPDMVIHDLGDEQGMHRAVGSQLIYNRSSGRSLFLATLTSDRWLTVLRLHTGKALPRSVPRIAGYEVDSVGTTELAALPGNALERSPREDRIELSLPLAAGAVVSSERLLLDVSADYHAQLESYGALIRRLHHARVSAPTPMGWWSWTAYYFGLNEAAAATNASWQAEHLKGLGYTFFHIDEGYQYARGEYSTADAALFPSGMRALGEKVRSQGLTLGVWTAPFEVSERAWVYENHKDWLVHNAAGKPIHAGSVLDNRDRLYILDTTHPAAQDYLRRTYSTLVRDWGVRYIKLDFMDDSLLEGYHFKPDTTALEAQRIGLQIIRAAVGEEVLLDKDGDVMLNPVGLVDMGRTSSDTGHTFSSSREAAPGIAARYYMNRNFYIADPDAFTVSRQVIPSQGWHVPDQDWHGGRRPLTLDEAKVSIALSAVSGGMYEIGDDLPTLGLDRERLALVGNRDLINMARLGRASRPLDLMSYAPQDSMPSLFLLRETARQSILTVFNWTQVMRSRDIAFAELGLPASGKLQVSDVFGGEASAAVGSAGIHLSQPPHSVSVLKIVDASLPAAAPAVQASVPTSAQTGKPANFSASGQEIPVPVLSCRWDFGDGTTAEGAAVTHTYTLAGSFTVRLVAEGVDGTRYEQASSISVSGSLPTVFTPSRNRRLGVQ